MSNGTSNPISTSQPTWLAKGSNLLYDTLFLASAYVLSGPLEALLDPTITFDPQSDATGTGPEKLSSFSPHYPSFGLGTGLYAILGNHAHQAFPKIPFNLAKNIVGFAPGVIGVWNDVTRFNEEIGYTPGQFLLTLAVKTGLMAGAYYGAKSFRTWRDNVRKSATLPAQS